MGAEIERIEISDVCHDADDRVCLNPTAAKQICRHDSIGEIVQARTDHYHEHEAHIRGPAMKLIAFS